MPPVNSSPSSDVDNEATAELPVLDVAAYEATMEMSLPRPESIPTLSAAVPAYDLDRSGTHELPIPTLAPPRIPRQSRPAKVDTLASMPPTHVVAASAAPSVPAPVVPPVSPLVAPPAPAPAAELPPSPPLITELRSALAQAERRIQELEERARIADAERAFAIGRANAECSQLREQLAGQLETSASVRTRLGVQRADHAELEDAFFARGDRIGELERDLAARQQALERIRSQVAAGDRERDRLASDVANLRATVARRDERIAMLEADLLARQQRESTLSARLAEALAVADPNVREIRAELLLREDKIRELKVELEAARQRVAEKNADLEVAEESIRNLESELRSKTGKLDEVSVTVEEWRAVIAESQRSILERDRRIQQLEAETARRAPPAPAALDQTGEEVTLEGPARVVIRSDGNTEFVHVLGRRTRIGRGADNELVVDTKHVSRYHAVLLAGPVHTSIEDLNSTNGTFVNGKRVTRQVLKDGDRLTVGRTEFRYTVRD
jgi:hypothetical protein